MWFFREAEKKAIQKTTPIKFKKVIHPFDGICQGCNASVSAEAGRYFYTLNIHFQITRRTSQVTLSKSFR